MKTLAFTILTLCGLSLATAKPRAVVEIAANDLPTCGDSSPQVLMQSFNVVAAQLGTMVEFTSLLLAAEWRGCRW